MKKIMVLTFTMMFLVINLPKVSAKVDIEMDSRFSDFNFYSCVRKTVGENNIKSDGYTIKTSALESITSISCRNYGISNVRGITLMKNLNNLYLPDNKIKSINLSKNTELEYLILNNNYPLTTINISNNKKLKNLELYSTVKLKSINLKNNTKLEWLDMSFSGITSLDLSKNTNLKRLKLVGNKLKSLNVSKNTKLWYLNLNGNEISSINLSKNTELIKLYLAGNKLTNIALYNNTKLEWLELDQNNLSTKPDKCVQLGNNCSFGYIVYFNTNGGSQVKPQNTYKVKKSPTSEKTDANHVYTIEGWYKNSNLTSRVTFPFSPTENITLYAKWYAVMQDLPRENETTAGLSKNTITIIVIAGIAIVLLALMSQKQTKNTRKTSAKRRSTKSKSTSKPATRKSTKTKSTKTRKRK